MRPHMKLPRVKRAHGTRPIRGKHARRMTRGPAHAVRALSHVGAGAAARMRSALAAERVRSVARMVVSVALIAAATGGAHPSHRADPASTSGEGPLAIMDEMEARRALVLPPATSVPTAAPAALARGPMQPREVTAFAPYWALDRAGGVDVRGVTTIAYFGVDVAGDGSLIRSGNGWTGYSSQALVDLITRAHRVGTRVVLTAKSFDPDVLRSLSRGSTAGRRLGRELAAAVTAKRLDGVNFDFEGFGSDYRAEFTKFIADATRELRAANPAWQMTIDTYATSAEVEDGFFDLRGLAAIVDALFVMGYDMYVTDVASPNAPLPRYERSMTAYVAQVPPAKIIWGMPFYGYDWPTRDNRPRSPAVGPKTPLTYSEIVAAKRPRYWDPDASVPWTAYQVGGQWHETYYDDPSSLALKSRLADRFRLRGVGAWALRMDQNDKTLIGALVGAVTSIVLGPVAPPPVRPATKASPAAKSSPRTSSSPKPKPSSSPTPSPSSSPLPVPLPSLVRGSSFTG